jgi:hypothetical protein
LESENETLRLKIANGRLEGQRKLLENMSGLSNYWDFGSSDLWTALRQEGGLNQGGNLGVPPSVASDRRHGQFWPMWRTILQLAFIRQRSRVIASTNPFAIAMIGNLTNYLIGTGCKYSGLPPEDVSEMEAGDLQIAADALQWFIDAWCKRNRFNCTTDPFDTLVIAESREREAVGRVVTDGEALMRLYKDDGKGWSDVRWIEPEQLDHEPGTTEQEGYFGGISHQMEPYEDVERRLSYYVRWQDMAGEDNRAAKMRDSIGEVVDAADVVHIMAPRTPATVARGTPMLAYGVGDSVERAYKLLRNASVGASVRAAIADIWKHTFGTQAQIQDFTAALADGQRINPYTGKTETLEHIQPGTRIKVPEGQEPVAQAPDNTESYLAALQADLRAFCSAFSAPEYWSGMTDNGNFSNLETASAPTVKMGESGQEHFKSCFLAVIWRAVKHAVDCGLLPKNCMRCVIQCEGPAVLHRDALQKSQQDQIDIQIGKKSRQTAAMEDGLDWEREEANNQEYQDSHGPELGELPMPGSEKKPSPAGVGGGE